VILLAITGLEVHYGGIGLFGFGKAVELHRIFAWAFVVLIVFAIFWHMVTGEWKQYKPTTKLLPEMISYYISGIFRGKEKPVHKTPRAKLNPLQKFAYLGLKILIIPVLVSTGFLYLYYPELQSGKYGIHIQWVAKIHVFAAFLMLAFLFIHVYLTTTGETPTSNIKAMITGYENLDVETSSSTEQGEVAGKGTQATNPGNV
jgi:thiosulfate reductase cytochrome b subunit